MMKLITVQAKLECKNCQAVIEKQMLVSLESLEKSPSKMNINKLNCTCGAADYRTVAIEVKHG